jgi:hypothetical protein
MSHTGRLRLTRLLAADIRSRRITSWQRRRASQCLMSNCQQTERERKKVTELIDRSAQERQEARAQAAPDAKQQYLPPPRPQAIFH